MIQQMYGNSGNVVLLLAAVAGCSSRPAAIESADIDPSSASRRAVALYDRDGDGALDDGELRAVPGVRKYKAKYDADTDGRVSRSEIAARLAALEAQKIGVRTLRVVVRLDGRPLAGAEVRFVPEPYFGDALAAATGTTDARGTARVSVATEDLPEALQAAHLAGIYGGTYKIEVTHPEARIPAEYNTQTTLGEEIARDTVRARVELELSTK